MFIIYTTSQTNTDTPNVVGVVNNLMQLVQNTTSLLDQTMINFDVIVGLVNNSREIVNETNLESGQLVEV